MPSSPLVAKPLTTVTIIFPISLNSASQNPRVVPAAVPNQSPEVKAEFPGSNGIPFLLQVIAEALFFRPWCFLIGGTDGIDGPTNSAGGEVNYFILDKIHCAGGNINKLLENNDSYNALKLSHDLILTGATRTNVADLKLLIVGTLHSHF